MVKAIVGANWGDEGKGKITDMLAESSDVVIRFQGGANAGHTIINDRGRFALHTLPSGAFYPHVTNIIGNGVALDIRKLVDELRSITDQGVPAPNLIISERAQLLMPYHTLQDAYEEERLGGKAFGSTKSGIAPFYSDKYAKIGIQVCDLFHEDRLMERLTAALTIKNVSLGLVGSEMCIRDRPSRTSCSSTCTTSPPWTPRSCSSSCCPCGRRSAPMWAMRWALSTRP